MRGSNPAVMPTKTFTDKLTLGSGRDRHGDVNTWSGFRDYVQFNRALLEAARSRDGKRTAEEIAAGLKPKFPVFTKEELLPTWSMAARRCPAP
jgi:hypothetical protein